MCYDRTDHGSYISHPGCESVGLIAKLQQIKSQLWKTTHPVWMHLSCLQLLMRYDITNHSRGKFYTKCVKAPGSIQSSDRGNQNYQKFHIQSVIVSSSIWGFNRENHSCWKFHIICQKIKGMEWKGEWDDDIVGTWIACNQCFMQSRQSRPLIWWI